MAISRRIRLEPLTTPILVVALAHAAVIGLAWYCVPMMQRPRSESAAAMPQQWLAPKVFLSLNVAPAPVTRVAASIENPELTTASAPPPPSATPTLPPVVDQEMEKIGAESSKTVVTEPAASAPATVPTAAAPEPKRDTSKYISLTRLTPEGAAAATPSKPYNPVPTLLDIAADRKATGKKESALDAVDAAIQTALLKSWNPPPVNLVPLGRRSVIVELSVARDGTLEDAVICKVGAPALNVSIAQLLESVKKVPVKLPSSFKKSSYHVQVNFQIE